MDLLFMPYVPYDRETTAYHAELDRQNRFLDRNLANTRHLYRPLGPEPWSESAKDDRWRRSGYASGRGNINALRDYVTSDWKRYFDDLAYNEGIDKRVNADYARYNRNAQKAFYDNFGGRIESSLSDARKRRAGKLIGRSLLSYALKRRIERSRIAALQRRAASKIRDLLITARSAREKKALLTLRRNILHNARYRLHLMDRIDKRKSDLWRSQNPNATSAWREKVGSEGIRAYAQKKERDEQNKTKWAHHFGSFKSNVRSGGYRSLRGHRDDFDETVGPQPGYGGYDLPGVMREEINNRVFNTPQPAIRRPANYTPSDPHRLYREAVNQYRNNVSNDVMLGDTDTIGDRIRKDHQNAPYMGTERSDGYRGPAVVHEAPVGPETVINDEDLVKGANSALRKRGREFDFQDKSRKRRMTNDAHLANIEDNADAFDDQQGTDDYKRPMSPISGVKLDFEDL